MSNDLRRTEGVKLIACREGEYYFVDSVFDYGDGRGGVTGTVCYPVSEGQAEELLSLDNLRDRFGDYWNDHYEYDVDEGCKECDGRLNEEGCEACGYPSLQSICSEIVQYEGIEAVIDKCDDDYTNALTAIGEGAKYADCTGGGRIFGSYGREGSMDPKDFDVVYDCKALVAILAFEDSAVSYEYAAKVIFG